MDQQQEDVTKQGEVQSNDILHQKLTVQYKVVHRGFTSRNC